MLMIRRFILALVCVVSFAAIDGQASYAADSKALKVAIVDMQMLLTDTKPAKSIQPQVKEKSMAIQAKFEKYEKELQDEQKALLDLRGGDDQDAFDKKREEFEKKYNERQLLFQKEKRNLDKAIQKSRNFLATEIYKVIEKLAEEQDYDLILNRSSVVIADKAFDITGEVKARLEKVLTKVELKVED